MGKFISNFTTTAEFNEAKNRLSRPHVSLTKDSGEIYYLKVLNNLKYFTTVARESGTISFSGNDNTSLSYSVNEGEWSEPLQNQVIEVNTGDRVRWKGEYGESGNHIGTFTGGTASFDIEGNIMSLLYGDNFIEQISLDGKSNVFKELFENSSGLVNAKNLVLPATTLADLCYYNMFRGCTSLVEIPELPATTLADNCYQSMFWGCTLLTKTPELPATTLADGCYYNMFRECTSLVETSELPATTLAGSCYQSMFWGCTSLVEAPVLPATTLVTGSYYNMFRECSSLNNITCLATSISASNCTSGWVRDVASGGTFTKAASMTNWTSGNNGIPSGWTIQNA